LRPLRGLEIVVVVLCSPRLRRGLRSCAPSGANHHRDL